MDFTVSIQMYLGVRWREPRISRTTNRNITHFGEDSFTALDTKFVRHLWVPDVYVYNMKYGSRVLKDLDGRLFVVNNDEIFYRQELIITVWCPLRFEFFPLDHQKCHFKLGSYTYNENVMEKMYYYILIFNIILTFIYFRIWYFLYRNWRQNESNRIHYWNM